MNQIIHWDCLEEMDKLISEWIIKKLKLWNDTVRKYYFNPTYWTIVKDPYLDLYDAFNEINWDKIY